MEDKKEFETSQVLDQKEFQDNDSQNIQNSAPSRANPLRKKTQAFIRFYTDLGKPYFGVGTECAILAGYSKVSASSTASEILSRPSVQAEIAKLEEERAKAIDWDFERWQRELIAVFDALAPTHPNKMRAIELIGKAKGFVRDNQIQLNTFNLIGDQDIAKMRSGIESRVKTRMLNSEVISCGQLVDNKARSTNGIAS